MCRFRLWSEATTIYIPYAATGWEQPQLPYEAKEKKKKDQLTIPLPPSLESYYQLLVALLHKLQIKSS